jgi:hypothetical protein
MEPVQQLLPWPVFGPDVAGLAGKLPAEVRCWGPAGGPEMEPPGNSR